MNYNYKDLFSLFNLQQKRIKDVLTEAQQALETLEFNRHLLERHSQITLRLQEIATSLEIINSRLEEIQGDQRLVSLGIKTGSQLPASLKLKNNSEASSPALQMVSAPEADQTIPPLNQDGKTPPSNSLASPDDETNLSNHSQFMQLEMVELSNQHFKLKTQKSHFEVELNSIEQQLTARGIGAAQG